MRKACVTVYKNAKDCLNKKKKEVKEAFGRKINEDASGNWKMF